MKIIIPCSSHDVNLLDTSLQVLRFHGNLQNHQITFSPAQSVYRACLEAAESIADLCPSVDVLQIPFEGDGRWPQSPNLHWALTLDALRTQGNKAPMFWKELDCDPLVPDWADQLEEGWRKGRAPFYGRIVRTPHRNAAGAIIYEPDDNMMMGCAVYAGDAWRLPQWEIMMRGFIRGDEELPWDVFLRGWMRKAGWADAKIIGDRWNTQNYRMQDGQLLCDPAPSKFKGRDHSREDVRGCVVIHGCKDMSLSRLILEKRINLNLPATVSGAPQAQPTGEAYDAILRKLDGVLLEFAALKSAATATLNRMNGIMDEVQDHHNKERETAREEQEQQQEQAADTHNGSTDIARVRGLVNGQNYSLVELSKISGIDKKTLCGMIQQKDSGLRLSKLRVTLVA